MAPPVFISYARSTNREHAQLLHQALGDSQSFLDTSDILEGERFPRALADNLLGACLVVIFADATYFKRWYCLRELRIALGPWDALSRRAEATSEEKNEAIEPVVVALPSERSGDPALLEVLPPSLRTTNWPKANEIDKLVELIEARLERPRRTLNEMLGEGTTAVLLRDTFLQESALPSVKSLAQTRLFPKALPTSIGDRFVGRSEDLSRLHLTLSTMTGGTQNAAALTGSLEGGAGFGKTRVAVEYLHRFGPAYYPGGLFWVNADVEEDRLEEQFHGILRLLRPKAAPESIAVFRKQGRNAFSELGEALHQLPPQAHVLFVIDNVPESAPGEDPKPLEAFCPAVGKVTVLATSRMKLSVAENVKPFPVGSLAPNAAVLLLTEGIDATVLPDDGWQRVAEWVGCLPLALELLNRAMKADGIHPQEVLGQVNNPTTTELDRARRALRGQVPSNALRGITETMAISYRRLTPATQRAARLLACISHEPIPLELLQTVGQNLFSPEIRAALGARSFVSPASSTTLVPFFGVMHRTLADFLRTQSPTLETDFQIMVKALASLMSQEVSENPLQWPFLSACLPHAKVLFFRRFKEDWNPKQTIGLGLRIGLLLSKQGAYPQARRANERVLQIARLALGEEHRSTLSAMNNLAWNLLELGEYAAARQLQEKVLAVRCRLLTEEHPETLGAMNNLASTLSSQGEFARARELHEKVLDARRRLLGEEHRDTLHTMGNLASTLWRQGEYAGGSDLQEEVVAASCRSLGKEHRDTLLVMSNLAAMLADQGEFAASRELKEEVLAAERKLLGEEHPDVLRTMGNLANTLSDQGELARARGLHEKVLEVRRRLLGEEHPDTLATMHNLANTLTDQGRFTQARGLQEKVLDARRRRLGEAHPDTFSAMNNLANTLLFNGEWNTAQRHSRKWFERARRLRGKTHPNTRQSRALFFVSVVLTIARPVVLVGLLANMLLFSLGKLDGEGLVTSVLAVLFLFIFWSKTMAFGFYLKNSARRTKAFLERLRGTRRGTH